MPTVPQIPYSGGDINSRSTSGGGTVQVPGGIGSGTKALGEDLFSLAFLFPAFQNAQAQRNRIEAHEKLMLSHIGANELALRAEMQFKDRSQALLERVKQIPLDKEGGWTLTEEDADGTLIEMRPGDVFRRDAMQIYKDAVTTAGKKFGWDAAEQVSQDLRLKVAGTYSQFEDENIKTRIGKEKASLTDLLATESDNEADPANPNKGFSRNRGLFLIDTAVTHGFLTAEEAVKMRHDFNNGIDEKYWTSVAIVNPQSVINMLEAGTTREGAIEKGLPYALHPDKVDKIRRLAESVLSSQHAASDRAEKKLEEDLKADETKLASELTSTAYLRDITHDIEQVRTLLPNEYGKLKALNRTLAHARHTDFTDNQKELSARNRFGFMADAKAAKLNPDYLKKTDEDLIATNVLTGRLTPQDGEPIIQAINEARLFWQSNAKTERTESIRRGDNIIDDATRVPAMETKYSAFIGDVKAQAKMRYYTMLEEHPELNGLEASAKVLSEFQPIILQKKEATIEDLTNQLQAGLKSIPRAILKPGTFEIDDAKANELMKRGSLSKAWVQTYKNIWASQRELIDIDIEKAGAEQSIREERNPPKKPKAGGSRKPSFGFGGGEGE